MNEYDYTTDLSDSSALVILADVGTDENEKEAAIVHLEGSINGGDLKIVRGIALRLLGFVEIDRVVDAI